MAVLFALASALSYGTSDFLAGISSRRLDFRLVTVVVQSFGFVAAVIGVLVFRGSGPTPAVLAWGAASGVGGAAGTLALYRGLAVGRMSIVATVSAVVSAVLPVLFGLALGEHLSVVAEAGVVIAIPAIGLTSWQRGGDEGKSRGSGLIEGILAGVGFSFLFIALDRAGTRSGAWPLVPGQAVSVALAIPLVWHARVSSKGLFSTVPLMAPAGLLGGTAGLLFLASTGHGQLAVVAVVAALYPAVTVLLARFVLSEHWSRLQAVGLIAAAVAIVLVGLG